MTWLPKNRLLFAGVVLALAAFHLLGFVFLDGFALDLGSLNFPSPRYISFVELWTVCGTASALLLALALSEHASSTDWIGRSIAWWTALPGRWFLAGSCATAVLIPLLIRVWLLKGAPLADDEGAYRFAAQLLASGRLWVASPPLKLFFDQNFMINDGRLYPAYFLGWPALRVVGVWLHAPILVNPILSALTVPPLTQLLNRLAGREWVKSGVVLFLSSPFIQVAASTELSHTACLMALASCLALYFRTEDADASWRHHAGFAFFAALAFCIRPQAAVPLGLPVVASWGFRVWGMPPAARVRPVLAFVGPAAFLAALFLGALWAQNGSLWLTGYARYGRYLVENDFRFTMFEPSILTTVTGFDFSDIPMALGRTLGGIVRLNFDLFGWPSSLVLLALALRGASRQVRLLWSMVGSYVVLMLFQHDWGIDTFGPIHAFEPALAILVLTMVGARNLGRKLTEQRTSDLAPQGREGPVLAACLVVSLTIAACLGFTPIRLEGVRQIAKHINVALRAPERAGLHRAVIFAPMPLTPPCKGVPAHFVFFHPTNDPDLQNDILWVNHVSDRDDLRFVETLPGRTGYVLQWTPSCDVRLLPLGSPASGG